MITYVNTVLVSNNSSAKIVSSFDPATDYTPGDFVIQNLDDNAESTTADANTDKFRIGVVLPSTTKLVAADGTVSTIHEIKWSNEIKKADIKSYRVAKYAADTEDTVTVDFSQSAQLTEFAEGGKVIVLRLTFKDLPTRFRNWTESYDYMTKAGDDAAAIASAFVKIINKQSKRARVIATASGAVLTLTAMPYDDDNSVDTINVAGKVRFNVTAYWQDPNAAGFASSNKYLVGTSAGEPIVTKVEGKAYTASAKLVRDREAQAMGYQGILNRGEGTWPIIKPAMVTSLDSNYDAITLEFENMYRAADDIFRKTKQTVEIYVAAGKGETIDAGIAAIIGTPAEYLNDTNDGAGYVEPANAGE